MEQSKIIDTLETYHAHSGEDRGSKGPAPLTSLYIEANMNVIIRQIAGKMV